MTITILALEDLSRVTGGQSAPGPNLPPGNYPIPTSPMASTPFKPFDFKATSQYGAVINNPGMPNGVGVNGGGGGGGGGGPKGPFAPQPELLM